MKARAIAAAIAGTLLLMPTLGMADDEAEDDKPDRQAMDDALFIGPLVAPNGQALPKGHWNIEPYLSGGIEYGEYGDNWGHHSNHNSYAIRQTTLLQYGLTDRISIGLLPQFGYNLASRGPSSRGPQIGDLTLRGQYMVHKYQEGGWLPTISIGLDQTVPTGKYDDLGNNPNDGIGGGVAVTEPALWMQHYFWMPNGRILRARLDLSYAISDYKPSIRGTSVFGTDKGFNGNAKVGNTFTADLGFEYSLTRHWVPVFEAIYSHTESGHVKGEVTNQTSHGQVVHDVHDHTRSSDEFTLAPAVEYNWNEHYGVIAGAEVTVAGRNTASVVTPQMALNMFF